MGTSVYMLTLLVQRNIGSTSAMLIRGVLKANSTPDIAHFTSATPMLDIPNVYIDGISIEDIKHTHGCVQTVEYTEIWETVSVKF